MSDSEQGRQSTPIVQTEHELQPWEKRCHALGDVLEFHSLINSDEKCRGIEALGREMGNQLTYYERWIAAFTNILFQKGVISPGEFATKLDQVKARELFEASDAQEGQPSV